MELPTPRLPNTLEECHAVIKELHALLQHLFKRVEKSETENKMLRERLNLDSNNSSKPPSSDVKKKPPKRPSSGKPSGGQKGHPGHYRALLDESVVDAIVTCQAPQQCEACSGQLIATGAFQRHQVHELPEIKMTVTEYRLYQGQCSCCLNQQWANLPEGVNWGITRPRLTSFMSMMIAQYQLSRRQLQAFLKEHFHFSISLGTVFNKQRLVNQVLEKPVEALLPLIQQSPSTHCDETHHRAFGGSHWLWVLASTTMAYFEISPSRGKKVLKRLLKNFQQILVSDRYCAYNQFDSSQRQLCWAHLKRDFTRLSQKPETMLKRIGKSLLACESQLFLLWHRFKKGEITRCELQRFAQTIKREVGEALEQGSYTAPELKVARFCKNLLENFSALWTFLEVEDVEPTNNHAERCLRPWVIWRKKYFGTRLNYGSEFVARSASLITTSRLQSTHPFHYLTEAIRCWFSHKEIAAIVKTTSGALVTD